MVKENAPDTHKSTKAIRKGAGSLRKCRLDLYLLIFFYFGKIDDQKEVKIRK